MNKTTKLHKYAILWLNSQGYSLEDISKEVKLNLDQVKRVIATQAKANNDPVPTTNDEPQTTIKQNSRSKNLMITDSNAKKFKVAIMTKDASMLNDELKKNTSTQKNTQDYIYRPDHE